jgi:hypothetical protein
MAYGLQSDHRQRDARLRTSPERWHLIPPGTAIDAVGGSRITSRSLGCGFFYLAAETVRENLTPQVSGP